MHDFDVLRTTHLRHPGRSRRRRPPFLGLALVTLFLASWGACSAPPPAPDDDDDDPGPASSPGICVDSCPDACAADDDCDLSDGEICCPLGELGNACLPAASCPRSCADDTGCDQSAGEACLRTSLHEQQTVCVPAAKGLRLCGNGQACNGGDVCCAIYDEPVCLPANLCPGSCSTSEECNTAGGEVCCTTLATVDPTLAVPGLCIDPLTVPCPTLCSASTDCNTQAGEVCCNGVCSTSCTKSCEQSSDCNGQVCCKHPLVTSTAGKQAGSPGYLVPSGGGGGTGGTGGGGAGGGGDPSCISCGEVLGDESHFADELCGYQGYDSNTGSLICAPGSSCALLAALETCSCAGSCAPACGNNLCEGFTASASCFECVTSLGCANQFAACAND